MSACNFTIPFSGSAEAILNKTKSTIEAQGGTFNGDTQQGNFYLSLFGNTISGNYTVVGQDLSVVVEEKPFLVPCSAIESFLKKQIS